MIAKFTKSIQNGEVKAKDIVEKCLKDIEDQRDLNAFVSLNHDALSTAEAIDEKVKQGKPLGRMAGVPVSLKDMICVAGMRTTAGSKMLENFISPYTATLVERLTAEDAIIIGKCNQDEFAMGSSNEHSFFGRTKNPWDTEFVPGGSSGGSAAAVAAGLTPVSIGSDTGGSIRQPAHFCGVVGLKPTYGRVSRYGVIAFASSLDQAGPLTNSVEDAARVLEVIAGKDKRDATTSSQSADLWAENICSDLGGKKIGIPLQLKQMSIEKETQGAFQQAMDCLIDAGAKLVDVDIPMMDYAVPVYYLVAASEASSNLARYDGVRYGYRSSFEDVELETLEDFYSMTRGEGFGSEVKRRIIMGTFFLSSGYYEAYFHKAGQVRKLLYQNIVDAYNKCDVIATPVATGPAFRAGENLEDPLKMYLNDVLTVMANLVGQPGISVPITVNTEGLPIGVQLLGRHFDEQMIFNAARAIEERAGFSALEGANVW